jgi:hypothetical protein
MMKLRFLSALCVFFFAVSAHAQSSPTCNPGDYAPLVNFHVGVSAGGSIVGFIWCNDSSGLKPWYWAWNPATNPTARCVGNINSTAAGTALLALWNNCISSGNFSADQTAAIKALARTWMPHLAVNAGGTHTIWDYAGCTSLTCEPVNSGLRIASGTPCNFPGGVATTQPAPNIYYSVAGQTSTTGLVLPAGDYSPCSPVFPPATGWP